MQSALERNEALAMLEAGQRPGANRCALASDLWRASAIEHSRRLRRGCTPTPEKYQTAAPPGRRCIGLFW